MTNHNPALSEDDDDLIDIPDDGGAYLMPGAEDDRPDVDDMPDDAGGSDAKPSDDDDSDLSVRVRKRIDKERRKRGDAERALEAERAEKDELRRQLSEYRGAMTNAVAENLDREYAGVRADLKQAIEDGDTDKQLELQEKLVDLRAEMKSVSRAKTPQGDDRRDDRQPARQPQSADERKEQVYGTMHPRARVWAKSLKLLDRPAELVGIAVSVEAAVAKSGIDPSSDDYYAELDRRLRTRAPELYEAGEDDIADGDGDDEPVARQPVTRPRATSPVAAPTRAAPPGAARPGRVTRLSAEQVSNMRVFGLDPTNPAHVAEYAKSVSR